MLSFQAEFERVVLAEGREQKHRYYNATIQYDAQKDKVASLHKAGDKSAAKVT